MLVLLAMMQVLATPGSIALLRLQEKLQVRPDSIAASSRGCLTRAHGGAPEPDAISIAVPQDPHRPQHAEPPNLLPPDSESCPGSRRSAAHERPACHPDVSGGGAAGRAGKGDGGGGGRRRRDCHSAAPPLPLVGVLT